MNKQSAEPNTQPTPRKFGDASAYSARIQEGMRHDRLSSLDYHLAMTILSAVTRGDTEEDWKKDQQRTLKPLLNQPADQKTESTDSPSGYDQMVLRLKSLMLWPWE